MNDTKKWIDLKSDEGRTQLANTRRFANAYEKDVCFVSDWNKWLIWDGMRWRPDTEKTIEKYAAVIADDIWKQIPKNRDRQVIQFAEKTSQISGINAMIRGAESLMSIESKKLDANPNLLTCTNGTLDLTSGKLREHRCEDYATKLCPTKYDCDASSPVWDQFLVSLFDREMIDFLGRFFGYCLTGEVSEQILAVFFGQGANGKSTFLNAIAATVGDDFCVAAPPNLLIDTRSDKHPTEFARLFGARLVLAQESSQGAKMAEATVKRLTGGDRISARRMREDFWDFEPTHKIVLSTNYKPQVSGTDHAIWRRLALIPFENRFWNEAAGEQGSAEKKQDKTLGARLAHETEGILRWMVQGCLNWKQSGLQIPAHVTAATQQYRHDSDLIGRFVHECCTCGPDFKVKFADLNSSFMNWCDELGEPRPATKQLPNWLQTNNCDKFQSGARWYKGIKLQTE